jgi:hypothetical protein
MRLPGGLLSQISSHPASLASAVLVAVEIPILAVDTINSVLDMILLIRHRFLVAFDAVLCPRDLHRPHLTRRTSFRTPRQTIAISGGHRLIMLGTATARLDLTGRRHPIGHGLLLGDLHSSMDRQVIFHSV